MTDLPSAPGNWRRHDANIVRALAALLIANSHLESLYPHPWMAGDGLMGNALFFFLSGYGVALGAQSRHRGFPRWYARRALRLYPAVIVAGLVIEVLLLGHWRTWNFSEWIRVFIYPTRYGYIGHIMIAYAALYWLLKPTTRWPLLLATALCASISLAYMLLLALRLAPGQPPPLGDGSPTTTALFWFYNTTLVLLGAWFGPATSRPASSLLKDAALFLTLFALYIGLKFEVTRGVDGRAFVAFFPLVALLCLFALRASASDQLQTLLERTKPVNWLISLLAAATLEMYIVQTWTHDWIAQLHMRFPLNLLAFWLTTLTGALILKRLTQPFLNSRGRKPRSAL